MAETKPTDASGIAGEEPSHREQKILSEICETPVEVYWNLNKRLWSVRQRGKVLAHVQRIALRSATWTVQPRGNARVREERKKNVHAWAKGRVAAFPLAQYLADGEWVSWASVRYSPYREKSFMFCSQNGNSSIWQPCHTSDFAFMRVVEKFVDSDERDPYVYAGWCRREHE